MPNIVKGKKILIMGLRNKWSIAWGITKKLFDEGAELAFTYQKERERDTVRELTDSLAGRFDKRDYGEGDGEDSGEGGGRFPIIKCDLGDDADIDAAFDCLSNEWKWDKFDGIVHAVAHARTEDMQRDFLYTEREGFSHALNISAYTLVAVARKAADMLSDGASILTLTYLGSQRVYPGYNVMGVAKAALESTVRYLANSLGARNIRVNAISSGPVKTVSAKAVRNFTDILSVVDEKSPLRRGVSTEEVGGAALYLLSDLSSAVTGEIHYVDCGFNIMGI